MSILLSDSANRQNPRIWLVLCDALKAQYEQSNERLYLKQATDTTTIFSLTMRLFETLSAFDSLDVRPDSKGRVRAEHRDTNIVSTNDGGIGTNSGTFANMSFGVLGFTVDSTTRIGNIGKDTRRT